MIEKGVNIHGDEDRISGLHYAAMHRNIQLIDYFLGLGCDINSKNGGISVIHIAWFHSEEPEIIYYLIDMGADVNVNDEWVKHSLEKGYDFKEYSMVKSAK